jgi:hypothetical protein
VRACVRACVRLRSESVRVWWEPATSRCHTCMYTRTTLARAQASKDTPTTTTTHPSRHTHLQPRSLHGCQVPPHVGGGDDAVVAASHEIDGQTSQPPVCGACCVCVWFGGRLGEVAGVCR